ncbi:LOW QUALITY PROTEIN: uncharacterized protein LOC143178950 [Calliopsis andreniformis]|uniref:LOW QUALITY PROTEIN: uncharacterized protein LOC143178950 n=1 Tax=Calliopsis andreniformis TaxID=337506 RepID=UPI003FCEAA97
MRILEEYKEFIDRDTSEISYFWKFVQLFVSFSCACNGYICSVLFYILWEHVFGGKCPLWATSLSTLTMNSDMDADNFFDKDTTNSNCTNWWKYVITDHNHENICKMYLLTCFLSCTFGVIWFALFLMCGKGGHDIAIYEAPWRIVPPALLFNFIFMIITLYMTSILENGFVEFSRDLKNIFLEICNKYKTHKDLRCATYFTMFLNYCFDTTLLTVNVISYSHMCIHIISINMMYAIYSPGFRLDFVNISYVSIVRLNNGLNTKYFQGLQSLMMWSWMGGFILLFLRIILVIDFTLLKVKIYEVPQNYNLNNVNVDKAEESNNKHKEKKV